MDSILELLQFQPFVRNSCKFYYNFAYFSSVPSGPFMSAIFRFFASFSEPGGLLLGRRQVEEGNALLGIVSYD